MNEVISLTEKIDDCKTAIEALELLITKHDLKPLRYAAAFVKEQKDLAVKKLATAKIDNIEVVHEEVSTN